MQNFLLFHAIESELSQEFGENGIAASQRFSRRKSNRVQDIPKCVNPSKTGSRKF